MNAQDIIKLWPSRNDLASDLGVQRIVVHQWHRRGNIPGSMDVRLIEAANRRSIALTYEMLAKARAVAA